MLLRDTDLTVLRWFKRLPNHTGGALAARAALERPHSWWVVKRLEERNLKRARLVADRTRTRK